jgi:hypothetical protein
MKFDKVFLTIYIILLYIYASGCSLLPKPTAQEIIAKGIKDSKSIVIMPTYYTHGTKMIWGKVGEKKRYIPLVNPNILNKQHFTDGSLLNNNYQVFVMDYGIYYIKNFSSSIESANYTLKLPRSSVNDQKFKSTIGNIWVEKTPQKERINGNSKI